MSALTSVHRLRGLEGRAAYEFDFSLAAGQFTVYWRASTSTWEPMTCWGRTISTDEIARRTGLDEAQASREIDAATAVCEREYLRRNPQPLHIAA